MRNAANSRPCKSQREDVNSHGLADQWGERSVLRHMHFHKGRMTGGDPEIDTAQTQKRLDGPLALLEKIRKTFTDRTQNNSKQFLIESLISFSSTEDRELIKTVRTVESKFVVVSMRLLLVEQL